MGGVDSTHLVAGPLSEILNIFVFSEALLSEILKNVRCYSIIGGTLE